MLRSAIVGDLGIFRQLLFICERRDHSRSNGKNAVAAPLPIAVATATAATRSLAYHGRIQDGLVSLQMKREALVKLNRMANEQNVAKT